MATKTVLVAGASGLAGYAALKHFARESGTRVIGVSRRAPPEPNGAEFMPVDLADPRQCAEAASAFGGVTHLVYAAHFEMPSLVQGWRDEEQILTNGRMLRNLLEPLAVAASGLRHVTLLQGTKAYGVHVQPMKVPAREGRSELREQPNFYWAQEDYLRAKQTGSSWHWTIVRPVQIVGEAVGDAMNLIPALGVHAAIQRAEGDVLPYPGGAPRVSQAVDADLLARAIGWAGEAPNARNETFNVANGDVFVWENVWPAIASAVGMRVGPAQSFSLQSHLSETGVAAWDTIRRRGRLAAPALLPFVGQSLEYADHVLRHGQVEPGAVSFVSTVKIMQAGFHEVMDTEAMFAKWFRHYQETRLLPAREHLR